MLVFSMVIWNILRSFVILIGHFGNVVVNWYICPRFGILCQEKSGNPVPVHRIFDAGVPLVGKYGTKKR
jgi:hypothetical protein